MASSSVNSLGDVLTILQLLEEADAGDYELEKHAKEMRKLLPRVLESQMAASCEGEVESSKTLLQCVKMLTETWPVVYEFGEVVGVAPCMFVLIPTLAVPSLSAMHESVMDALDALLCLLLTKDIWSTRVLLDDCLQLLSDAARPPPDASDAPGRHAPQPGARPEPSRKPKPSRCFGGFHEVALQWDSGIGACFVDLSGQEQRRLMFAGMAKLVTRIVTATAHFFQTSFRGPRIWELLCAHLGNVDEEQDCFRSTSVALLATLCHHFPAPLTLEDTIGDAIIASLRNAVHRPPPTTEHAEALAVCLEAGFEQLSGRCVRALAEELLATLFSYLCLPAAAPRVKAAVCRVVEATLRASAGHTAAVMRTAPHLSDAQLRAPLVRLARAALALARGSPAHAQATLALFGGDDVTGPAGGMLLAGHGEEQDALPGGRVSASQKKRAREWWEANASLPSKRRAVHG
ncbi:hypothetical protein T484DRAFT_1894949, partial [Baffinella frigidus]